MLYLAVLVLLHIAVSSTSVASAETTIYTIQYCNYTQFTKTGCEDEIGAECIDNRCRCKPGHSILYDGRFCFRRSCPDGQYFDEYQNICIDQRPASPSVAESHCRYDYHCFGPHVRCKLYGWNRNCVCDPGFTYGYNGTCIPLHGIGGHCQRDMDCDSTGHRKMLCEVKSEAANTKNIGTCQCVAEHTYNYHVDGCESNERIRERRNNMRTLIILFVLCATVFGFALTFNFGLLGSPSRQQQAMLLKRLAQEKERYDKRQQQLKAAEEGAIGEAPSAPPVAESAREEIAEERGPTTLVVDLERKAGDSKRLIALD